MNVKVAGTFIATAAIVYAIMQAGGPGGGGTPTPTPTPTATAVPITCDQVAANSTQLASAVTAASNGQKVCLTAAADYGTWTGTNKTITLVSQNSAQGVAAAPNPVDATIRLQLTTGDSGFTIDGGMDVWRASGSLNIPTADIDGSVLNVTIKNFEANGTGGSGNRWDLSNLTPTTAGTQRVLIDHFYAHDATAGEAFFYVDDTSGTASAANDTGVTIQRGLLKHMSNDGIKLTGNDTVRVLNNRITDMHESHGSDGNHTDGIQWIEANHVIKGNWVNNCDQCIFSDDGGGNSEVTHNIVDQGGQHFMEVSSDQPWGGGSGSLVKHNLITTRTTDLPPEFNCGNSGAKNGFQDVLMTSLTDIQNNIFPRIGLGGGNDGSGQGLNCTPVANHHNMLATGQSTTGTGGSNFTGSPTFVGGSVLSSFDSFSDWCLAPGSAGITGAADGGQVGVCGGDYDGSNYGPPAEAIP